MADIIEKVTKALAIVGGAIMGLLGGWTPLFTALAAFMVLDYITGLAVAFKGKSTKSCDGLPSSKAGFVGLMRKAGIVAAVFMGAILDRSRNATGCICNKHDRLFCSKRKRQSLKTSVPLGFPYPMRLRRVLR